MPSLAKYPCLEQTNKNVLFIPNHVLEVKWSCVTWIWDWLLICWCHIYQTGVFKKFDNHNLGILCITLVCFIYKLYCISGWNVKTVPSSKIFLLNFPFLSRPQYSVSLLRKLSGFSQLSEIVFVKELILPSQNNQRGMVSMICKLLLSKTTGNSESFGINWGRDS